MFKLRLFKTEDTGRVLQLANAYAAFDMSIDEADLSMAKSFPNGFWIAEEDDRVVGVAYGYFRDVPPEVLERWEASKAGYVALMAVDESYRRRGIGGALLKRLLEEFRKAGADVVTVHCPAEAIEAKKLYDKLGFEVGAYHMKRRL